VFSLIKSITTHLFLFLLAGSQIGKLNECKTRCSLPIPAKDRMWCRKHCSLRSLQIRSLPPSFQKRVTPVSSNGNIFKPKPTWIKVISPTTSKGYVSTTIIKRTKTEFSMTTQTTTSIHDVTVITQRKTTRTKQRFNSKNTSERMAIEKNIDYQDVYLKLAGGLLGVCFVIFVACCVWRSVKKPHRISFTDEPIIVIHTGI